MTETSKSQAKKIHKKVKRAQQIVKNDNPSIIFPEYPTNDLLICNAGLVNGLSHENVVEEFTKHGTLKRVYMPASKSYCFITYETIDQSTYVMNTLNGTINLGQNHTPLYLTYVEFDEPKLNHSKLSIPGLTLIEDFVDETTENDLLGILTFDETKSLKHRLVKHYGYEFRYDTNNVDKDCPLEMEIPELCQTVVKKMNELDELKNFIPDQLTVNRYRPGQGIPSHVDTHSAFTDTIVSLSLGAATIMQFDHRDGTRVNMSLPRRSLLILANAARYEWKHGIVPRKMDVVENERGHLTVRKRDTRTSFTFRQILRQSKCECQFSTECDSVKEMTAGGAGLEDRFVHQVYNEIAGHFSETRHKPWPNVVKFLESFEAGDVVVDVGCGNGKYLAVKPDVCMIGCDMSQNLLQICRTRGFETFTCNCLHVPLKSNMADGCISIAVIHHLSTKERRLQAFQEIARILRVNGRALVYVWAKNQRKNDVKSNYLKENVANNQVGAYEEINGMPVHENRTQFQHSDVLVPWKLKDKNTFLRYYHVFDEEEMIELCRRLDNVNVLRTYYDQGNWCVIFEKTS